MLVLSYSRIRITQGLLKDYSRITRRNRNQLKKTMELFAEKCSPISVEKIISSNGKIHSNEIGLFKIKLFFQFLQPTTGDNLFWALHFHHFEILN